ncbi:MAG: nucleoside triphosphate pyrophosphohydrolase [Deltaproteobacteria bacterium]|nr:nucleoside triphosphate pyrophosphohydrolase [Deltaproteobacteria bacterium]
MAHLAAIMERLRAPGGCPWDREQTLESLKPYVIEEAYEVLEAIEHGDPREHCEELGDLLMQVVFQAEVAREAKSFDLGDVANAIATKLVRRHPHVFGDVKVKDSSEVLDNWEALKKKEKAGRGALSGVPRALPGLIRALRMGEKAARAGFDFVDAAQALTKVREETDELAAATSAEHKRQELGDLLFAVVNVARKDGIDPEEALREAMDRFGARFSAVESAAGDRLRTMSDAEKEALWQRAKTQTAPVPKLK